MEGNHPSMQSKEITSMAQENVHDEKKTNPKRKLNNFVSHCLNLKILIFV